LVYTTATFAARALRVCVPFSPTFATLFGLVGLLHTRYGWLQFTRFVPREHLAVMVPRLPFPFLPTPPFSSHLFTPRFFSYAHTHTTFWLGSSRFASRFLTGSGFGTYSYAPAVYASAYARCASRAFDQVRTYLRLRFYSITLQQFTTDHWFALRSGYKTAVCPVTLFAVYSSFTASLTHTHGGFATHLSFGSRTTVAVSCTTARRAGVSLDFGYSVWFVRFFFFTHTRSCATFYRAGSGCFRARLPFICAAVVVQVGFHPRLPRCTCVILGYCPVAVLWFVTLRFWFAVLGSFCG